MTCMKNLKFITLLFLGWRLLLFLPLFIAPILLPYRLGYEYTGLGKFVLPTSPVLHFLLSPWANFDGIHYLRIASEGYTNNGGFFPLYSILIWLVSFLFGSGATFSEVYFFVALILSNVFFFLALLVLYALVRLDYSESIAKRSMLFLILFPTSFFFVSVYTESLFLLLSLLVFFHARRREWLQVGVLGMLLSATRIVGIAIFPTVLYEFFIAEHVWLSLKEKKDIWKVILKSIPLFIIPLGLLIYMWFNLQKWGDALYFLKTHGALGNSRSIDSIILFPQTVVRYSKILATVPITQYDWWVAFLEITSFIVVGVLLYAAWKKRIRFSYILFTLLCFFIPASSGTFTALPRYIVILFPLFIALSLIENKIVRYSYAIISSILFFVLLVLFSRGYFVA